MDQICFKTTAERKTQERTALLSGSLAHLPTTLAGSMNSM